MSEPQPLDLSDKVLDTLVDEMRQSAHDENNGGDYIPEEQLYWYAADVIAALVEQRKALLSPPSDGEVVAFFEIYAADVRYEAGEHPRMLWLMKRALSAFLEARKQR